MQRHNNAPAPVPPGSVTILVVDDEPALCHLLQVSLERQHYRVIIAHNGNEALDVVNSKTIDLVLLDVMMPEKDGFTTCMEMRKKTDVPIVLLTALSRPDDVVHGFTLGADDYITKPFEKDMLVARVQSLIKKQQNLQKYFYNEITHQQNTLNISGEYKDFLEACISSVERNLDKDEFNIQVLAQDMGMSHSKLYKKIKTISGQSANSFIRYIRLRKAAELFINSDYNISETAFYVGIKDIKYFREQFNRTFGMKPSEYIEKYRKIHGKSFKLNDKLTRDNE
jgi:DNA-binding response OmpR family regulator